MSGGVVRKSVNDMFDDALKTAANPQGLYNLGSSSGVSMRLMRKKKIVTLSVHNYTF